MNGRPSAEAFDQARERLQASVSPAGERYLTVFDIAELAQCDHKTVRRAIAAGKLQAFKVTKLLVRESDARAWIESRPTSPSRPAGSRPGSGRSRRSRTTVQALREMEPR